MKRSKPGASLAARIAWGSALTVPISGSLVVLVSWLIAGSIAREAEDAQLRDAVAVFARELEEDGADPHAVAVDEANELLHTGILVAVREGDLHVAGDASLEVVSSGRCRNQGALRVCGRDVGRWTAIVGRARSEDHDPAGLVLTAGLLAVLATSLLGAAVAYAVGRRIAAPVVRLEASVARVSAEDLARADLGPSEGVAEIDALREALTRAFHALGEALERERRFARDAAHELRTPLTLVLGELDLVAEQLTGSEREGILRARRVAARLETLVERLLLLARPGEARGSEPVDLVDLVEDVRAELTERQRARVRISGEPVEMVGDATLLAAMIGNAVENALKFSTGEVRVSLEHDEALARVVIEDEGPGVPPEERALVFSPFYRTRAARAGNAGGHGIGLALIAHAAALHGGTARFVDGARGARLEITLATSAAR